MKIQIEDVSVNNPFCNIPYIEVDGLYETVESWEEGEVVEDIEVSYVRGEGFIITLVTNYVFYLTSGLKTLNFGNCYLPEKVKQKCDLFSETVLNSIGYDFRRSYENGRC